MSQDAQTATGPTEPETPDITIPKPAEHHRIEELEAVIAQLGNRIHRHGIPLSQSRKRTEMALIHPILDYMDWDTTDPTMVTPDYEGEHYALIWRNRIKALIATRALSGSMRYNGDNKINLCGGKAISNLLITNGNWWTLRKTQFPDDQPLSCEITGPSLTETAFKLLDIFRIIG